MHGSRLPRRIVGFVLAFGAGTLISSVAFELTEDAYALGGADVVALGLALGALAYFCGTLLSGGERWRTGLPSSSGRSSTGSPSRSSSASPCSAAARWECALLAAVFISNLPESISSSREMAARSLDGRRSLALDDRCRGLRRCGRLRVRPVEGASDDLVGLVQAFAGGAVLTMLSETMIPDAYNFHPEQSKLSRGAVGLLTMLGFSVAYLLSTLEELQNRQEALDLERGDLHAVVVPLPALDLDEAVEGVLAEHPQDQL